MGIRNFRYQNNSSQLTISKGMIAASKRQRYYLFRPFFITQGSFVLSSYNSEAEVKAIGFIKI
jgi:hypothetical protein